jgi:hypothetical protein
MINCDDLHALLAKHVDCEQTPRGLRFSTHVYYPSHQRVNVYVTSHGDGYLISDGGEAASEAFLLGRDEHAFEAALKRVCNRHALKPANGALLAEVNDREWLFPAILAVANGAAQAAAETSTRVSERRIKQLKELIRNTMIGIVPEQALATEYQFRGNSGRLWKIDYAVLETRSPLLLKALIPERNSINGNYTAFGDIAEVKDGIRRFSVFDSELKTEDKSLMLQVAELIPVTKLEGGARAALQIQSGRF